MSSFEGPETERHQAPPCRKFHRVQTTCHRVVSPSVVIFPLGLVPIPRAVTMLQFRYQIYRHQRGTICVRSLHQRLLICSPSNMWWYVLSHISYAL